MASYEQSKASKLWSVRFREVGKDGISKQKRLSGFKTKKAAQYGYEEYIQQKNAEEQTDATPDDLLFDALLDLYYKYKETRLKASSFYDIQSKLNKQVLPTFSGKRLRDIKPIDILSWQNNLSSTYSASYVSHLTTLFTSVYKYGEKYHDVTNIMVKVDKPRNNTPKKEMDFWTLDEFKSFISAADNPTYKMFFTLLYIIGCRRGEAEALFWEDVDLNKHEIKITKSLTRKSPSSPWELTTPKNTSSVRSVPIPQTLASELQAYKEQQAESCENPLFVFGGERPLASRTTDRYFADTCDTARVKKIRIHDLRHSCASLLISKGVSIVATSKLLGHADVHMTLNVYAHMLEDDKSKMLRELENALTK